MSDVKIPLYIQARFKDVEKKWKENDVVSGAIVLLFDHHKGDIGVKMNEIQHQFYKEILSAQHFHKEDGSRPVYRYDQNEQRVPLLHHTGCD